MRSTTPWALAEYIIISRHYSLNTHTNKLYSPVLYLHIIIPPPQRERERERERERNTVCDERSGYLSLSGTEVLWKKEVFSFVLKDGRVEHFGAFRKPLYSISKKWKQSERILKASIIKLDLRPRSRLHMRSTQKKFPWWHRFSAWKRATLLNNSRDTCLTGQWTLGYNRLSSLSHCGLLLA